MHEKWEDGIWFLNYSQYEDLRLYEVGRQKCHSGYEFGPIIRDKYIIHYVSSGKGKLFLDQKEYEVKAGCIFLLPPNTLVRYQADEQDPWHYMWIHVHGFKVVELLQKAGLSRKDPVLDVGESAKRVEKLILDICENREEEYTCIGKLYLIFQLMIRHIPEERIRENQTEPALGYIHRVIDYINQKYSEPVSVQGIADFCGIDRSYLSKIFRYATGYTVQEYLIQYRIKKAKQFLRETALPVKHVSYSVGYNDPFTFSKVFKKVTGKTPTEYIKECK